MRTQKQRQWNRLPTLLEELEQDRAFERMLKSRFDQCCTTEALDLTQPMPRHYMLAEMIEMEHPYDEQL